MTFDATVNPVVYEGGVPIFIDTEWIVCEDKQKYLKYVALQVFML